jgi:hypothetical protein
MFDPSFNAQMIITFFYNVENIASTFLTGSGLGVYILENTPPPPGRISADVIWGAKNMKRWKGRGKM